MQHIGIGTTSQYEDAHIGSGQFVEGRGHFDSETNLFFSIAITIQVWSICKKPLTPYLIRKRLKEAAY